MNKYPLLFSSVDYGGITLKNRLIFAPTTLGLSKKKYLQFITNLAKGGVGLIIIGDVPVGKNKFVPDLYHKKSIKLYKDIVNIAHQYDCKVAAQLHEDDTDMNALFKCMPKFLSHKLSNQQKLDLKNKITSDYVSSIPTEKVDELCKNFAKAALKVKDIGFDMIQIHGDRMCGSFTSTIFNKRKDKYNGDIKSRSLFATNSIKAIREVLPDIPIDFKLVIRLENPNYGRAGVTLNELKDFIRVLDDSGVTSYHVTLANHSNLSDTIPNKNHECFNEEGCFLFMCDEVRKYTNKPITGVGGISHPEFIEKQLLEKRIDCVAMSRQLIADPNYLNKLKENKENDINYCVRCNKKCLGGLMSHRGVSCIYNNKNLKK